MQALYAGQVGVREIEGRVSVPWTVVWTHVSVTFPPPAFSPVPSASAHPSSSSPPVSSAPPVSAAGTDSLPAWSFAGPEEEEELEGR